MPQLGQERKACCFCSLRCCGEWSHFYLLFPGSFPPVNATGKKGALGQGAMQGNQDRIKLDRAHPRTISETLIISMNEAWKLSLTRVILPLLSS